MGVDQDLKKENGMRKGVITGVAVLCEMLSGGLFLENVKMEKQRTSDPYPVITSRILKGGIAGFEAGFWPWGFILGMTKGVVLGSSRAIFLNLFLDSGMKPANADLISGFCAGGVQGVFMGPILLARTRVNQHLVERAKLGEVKGSFFEEMKISMNILNKAIVQQGIGTLFIGMPTMVFKRSLDWGSRFIFMRWVKELMYSQKKTSNPKAKLNDFENFVAAFIGGTLSVFVTQPIDRLMPILQAAGRSKDQGIFKIISERFAKEGLTTLQRGFVARTIHCGWHTAFAIFLSQKIYDIIDQRFPTK